MPNKTALAVAIVFAQFTNGSFAHDLGIEIVEVTASKQTEAGQNALFSQSPVTRPTHDAGELLRSVNGMTALRRGGRGFEPIIRGQSQANLNVIANGSFTFGACPGRMDPPSTYVGIDSFDKVTVIKGHRSVVYGAGGSGGTLLFEHSRPEFGDQTYTATVTAGYTGNSDLKSLGADVAAGNDQGFIRLFGASKSSDNYDDGDGQTVASAFDSRTGGIIMGYDLSAHDYLEFSHERASEDDIWYAGNGMDGVYADARTSNLKWQRQGGMPFIDELEVLVYRSDVDHLMDNYTVRPRNSMPNGMATPSASDTTGGRIIATRNTTAASWRTGLDYRANQREATLFADTGKDGVYDLLGSRIWPDTDSRILGLFAELDYEYSSRDLLRIGLRVDDFSSEARTASAPAGMMGNATPNTLYQSFYGTSARENTSTDASIVLGWDHRPSDQLLLSGNLSRSVRSPDASELWIARSAMGRSWVGNPSLDPEIHQQLDLTLQFEHTDNSYAASLFVDRIDDYIERYQVGSADLYRNSKATLYGLELEQHRQWRENLSSQLRIAYTRGEGENDDLPQIAPLEARVNLDYVAESWGIGAEWVVAARQDRLNAALDVAEETPGFSVLHLYSHWQLNRSLLLEAGIENVFDRRYAYHVNAGNADPFNPDAVRVNEPGRQLWLKLRYQFSG